MLIDFYVGHFLSFDEIQRFSMRSSETMKGSVNCIENETTLKASFVYGPNAAGKSNLVKAFIFSKGMITKGSVDYDEKIPATYLHRNTDGSISKEPAYFEYVVKIGKTLYQYGLEVGENPVIASEWLYKSYENKHETLFSIQRPYGNPEKQELSIDCQNAFGEYVKETSKHTSFLDFCTSFDEDCHKLYAWFYSYLIVNSFEYPNISMVVGKDFLSKFVCLLEKLDTKITGYVEIGDSGIEPYVLQFTKDVKGSNNDSRYDEINTVLNEHPGSEIITFNNGKLYYDRLSESSTKIDSGTIRFKHFYDQKTDGWGTTSDFESTGTQRIISLELIFQGIKEFAYYDTNFIGSHIDSEKTIIVDEVECSLHPVLVSKLIDILLEDRNNSTQVIMTTHEMLFLSSELFNNDAYWFVNRKNDKTDESTELYSLAEYPEISKKEYRLVYETGKVGAIPKTDLSDKEGY